ncbi:hypothetical protein BTE48_15175 [Oceanospirillum multiglobuliferum]|uniref:histidine kinase n=2 Tax=Oceanospirillum multiglobuliferum TaxID=64969 RepID=A0A1V4T262_9GAMM|nr:hypothetical protein BTE48_15175 [Oceanospirillum multiglobuliferum]
MSYPVFAVIFIAAMVSAWVLYQARIQQNKVVIDLAEQGMSSATSAILKNQKLLTKDYAFWEETLIFSDNIVATGTVDESWAKRNIADYLNTSFHLDFTAIFNAEGILWLYQNEEIELQLQAEAISEALTRMKVFERLQVHWQKKPPEILSGYIYIGQQLYIIGTSLITSDNLELMPSEQDRTAFLVAKAVNPTLLEELEQLQNAEGLRLESLTDHSKHQHSAIETSITEAYMPIQNLNNETIAILCWKPLYRADDFYQQLIPWLIGFLLISGACIAIYIRKVQQEGNWLDGEIARRKQAERQLEEHKQKLEELVRERTDALFKALKAAELAGEEKSRFTARMSHEMRTPLNAISGFTQLLQFEETDPDKLEQLSEIHTASDRLLEIVNQVLNLSDLGVKHEELQNEHCSLDQVITPLLFEYQGSLKAKGTHIELVSPVMGETAVEVQLPVSILNHALKVLLDNACLYTHGNSKIELQVHQTDAYCELWVCDTGLGIPENKRDKLFQPFSRLHFDQLPNAKGVGLNLFMLRKQLEDLGADVQYVGTHQPQGSCFRLCLPLHKSKTGTAV